MADKKDDPREVLSLLNSLGFVGITAQQLKGFMKDLKMHRKIKERERQQWKDDTKKKIMLQQQQLYKEVLREHKMERGFTSVTESTISSESSAFHDDSSSCKLVTVKIKCFPKDRENEAEKENNDNYANTDKTSRRTKRTSFTKTHTSWAEEFRQNSLRSDSSYNTMSSSASVDESHGRFDHLNNQSQNHSVGASTDSTKYISLEKPRGKAARFDQNLKQSNLAPPKPSGRRKSSATRCLAEDKTENVKAQQETANVVPANPPPSRSSAASSRSKSFIRPWRLQPESHKSCTNTKSDPVALYQKYRDEWKQLALPGEENHAGIRWAVREKMLGIDPNPRPCEKTARQEMSTDRDSWGSISKCRKRKVGNRKSRKIRKIIYSSDSIRSRAKMNIVDLRERRKYFKSISESFLIRSKSFEVSRDTREIGNFRSIFTLSSTVARYERKEIKIEKMCKTESIASIACKLTETRSEVNGVKRTLGRIVGKILERDINIYVENYKCMNKCYCFLKTELP